MIRIKATQSNWTEVRRTLDMLSLDPARRRRLLMRLGRMVVAQGQRNIKEQKTVDGAQFAPRSRRSDKRGPMLKRLMRSKWAKVRMVNGFASEVFFLRGVGYVARKHQEGGDEEFRRERHAKLFAADELTPGRAYFGRKCNERQATELVRCGFRDKGGRRRSRPWIMENVTVGQAVEYLKATKESWVVKVPARPFLGISEAQRRRMIDVLYAGIDAKFRAKDHGDLLN